MRTVILASTSPRRRELLERLGIPFSVEPGEYEEDMSEKIPPEELAEKLALGKALSVVARYDDAIVIGGDTFISFKGVVLGKPHTASRAREMLSMLSGKTHEVLTGYALVDTKSGEKISGVETGHVTFRELSSSEIDEYIATGEPLDRAGAYAIQSGGAAFVEKVDGDMLAIIGLPLTRISEGLMRLGVETSFTS